MQLFVAFKDRRHNQTHERGWPIESGKGKEMDDLPEPLDRNKALLVLLVLASLDLCWNSDL